MEAVETRPGRAQPLLFTSETYPEIGRETAWCDFLTPLGFRPLRARDDGFYAHASALFSPLDIGFARIAAAPHGLSAVPNRAAAPLVLLHVDGDAALREDATETALKPGDVVVLPRSGTAELVYASPFRALAVTVPRDVFGARLIATDAARPARIAQSQGLGRVLSAMLTSIASTMDTLSASDLATIDLALSELLLSEFDAGATVEPGASATQAALRRRLCQTIESRLGDPDLTLSQITQVLGISERYAQKLFETIGESFTHYLRDRRLLRSRRELGSPQHTGVSVSEIGYRCGFNDAAHFSRVFRERFGVSPREHRQRATERSALDVGRPQQRGRPQTVARKPQGRIAAASTGGDPAAALPDLVLEPTRATALEQADRSQPKPIEKPNRHYIAARADTVHWGYFSRAIPPVLAIASGDIVTIETLSQHAS
ncbi:helix-turn-helix domain-containing protein, partial [Beijerinckia sp. L45]|uniref:helix-turn-helix domain-containing protein n=1 Tax=Beijerinckia sp. L45 TaxID=1641855 RepID=UPI00131D2D28